MAWSVLGAWLSGAWVLATHLVLAPLPCRECMQDPLQCAVMVLVRVYNQLVGHPC